LSFKKEGSFKHLMQLVETFYSEKGDTAEIELEIVELMSSMPENIRPKINESVQKFKGNRTEMTRIVEKMRGFKQA
jgi:hypothetical protein